MKEYIFIDSLFYGNINQNTDRCPHAKIDIFQKKYIIIPCHITMTHWALIVVCNHKNIVKCMDYVKEGSLNADQEGYTGESPSFILYFDSMVNKSTISINRIKMKIRRTILKYLKEEARTWNLSDHEKLATLDKKDKCYNLVLPVLNVDDSKSCYLFTIVRTV